MSVQSEMLATMGVTMSAVRRNGRSALFANDWDKKASHWNVTVRRGIYSITFAYSMGSAHTGQPQIDDVMHCMLSDAMMAECHEGAEDMAESLGMPFEEREERRKAVAMWSACVKMDNKLKIMFDESEREELDEIFQDY